MWVNNLIVRLNCIIKLWGFIKYLAYQLIIEFELRIQREDKIVGRIIWIRIELNSITYTWYQITLKYNWK